MCWQQGEGCARSPLRQGAAPQTIPDLLPHRGGPAWRPSVSDAPAPANGHRRRHHPHPHRARGERGRRLSARTASGSKRRWHRALPAFPPAPPGNFSTKQGLSQVLDDSECLPEEQFPLPPFCYKLTRRELHVRGCVRVHWHLPHRWTLSQRCDGARGDAPRIPSAPLPLHSQDPQAGAEERQKFGVPPRPSPPRSPAGAEDEAGAFKAHGCHPAAPGVGYLSGLQGPAGPRLSALLEPRRVTAPPARRGASAPLCTPPLPRTPRFPPSPPALLQQAPPCPGLAPPARGDPAGRCRGSACGWGYAPVALGELCFAFGTGRWCCPYPARLLPARPGAAGGRRAQPGPGKGGGDTADNKVTLSGEVCLSLASLSCLLTGSFIFRGAVCTRALPKRRSRLGGVRA